MDYREILLGSASKGNFIKGLVRIAKADGVICEDERQYFMMAASHLGVDFEQLVEIECSIDSNDQIAVQFDTKKEKVLFLREAIQLCSIDGKYDINEQNEIKEIASELDVPDSCVKRLEEWVAEGMKWKERGDTLLDYDFQEVE